MLEVQTKPLVPFVRGVNNLKGRRKIDRETRVPSVLLLLPYWLTSGLEEGGDVRVMKG